MISGIVTAVLLLAFLVLVGWAYSSKQKQRFDEAAALPLIEDRNDKGGAR